MLARHERMIKIAELPTEDVSSIEEDVFVVEFSPPVTKRVKWSNYRDILIEKIVKYGQLGFMAGSHSGENLEMYEKYTAKQEICFTEIKKQLGIYTSYIEDAKKQARR